jgi:hypothetical protein
MNAREVIKAPDYLGHTITYTSEKWTAHLEGRIVASAEQLPALHEKLDKLAKKAERFERVNVFRVAAADRYRGDEGVPRVLQEWVATSRNGFEVRFQLRGGREWESTRYVDRYALDTPENRAIAEKALQLYAQAHKLFNEAQAVEKTLKPYRLPAGDDNEVVR